jgi:hypothetical protein
VSRGVIFQELHVIGADIIQFIPFVHAFYEFESHVFYNHYNHGSNFTIIPFAMVILGGGGGGGHYLFKPILGLYFFHLIISPLVYFHPL